MLKRFLSVQPGGALRELKQNASRLRNLAIDVLVSIIFAISIFGGVLAVAGDSTLWRAALPGAIGLFTSYLLINSDSRCVS